MSPRALSRIGWALEAALAGKKNSQMAGRFPTRRSVTSSQTTVKAAQSHGGRRGVSIDSA